MKRKRFFKASTFASAIIYLLAAVIVPLLHESGLILPHNHHHAIRHSHTCFPINAAIVRS
jgi:hypothetical protein